MKSIFTSKGFRLGCGFVGLCFFLAMAWPVFVFWNRPRTVTFNVGPVYHINADSKNVSGMEAMSRSWVVLEGPCTDGPNCPGGLCGCHGGIMISDGRVPTKANLPAGMKNYDPKANAVIWVYGVRPTKIKRRNDVFGEDEVTIEGQQEKGQSVFLTLVPKALVSGHLEWAYVDLPPQR